jgi:predicted enzyme related to lactoylglutathione lyase
MDINLTGKFIGASLTVKQAEKVRDFYKQVIGWEHVLMDKGDYHDFRMVASDGQFVAGIHHQTTKNIASQLSVGLRLSLLAT